MPNDEVTAAAEHAPLTGQVREFLAWLGDGRKLTQTGRIGLADARYLVELLGTRDEMDPEIGGRVFKTKSSEELSGLMRVVEWAKAALLVRVIGGKLVPTRKHAALADRPLDLVLKLLDAYPKLGRSLFPRGYWRQSIVGDEFAAIGPALLTALLRGAGQVPLADFSDMAEGMIEERYELSTLTEIQRDHLHGTVEADVRIALSHLQALGVTIVSRNSAEADQYGTLDWSKATAELTDLGRYAIRRLRGMAEPGDPVLTIRVALLGTDSPEVWRRVLIPASFTLDRVHMVMQEAMGWQNSHLHEFRIAGREYGMPEIGGFDDSDALDERKFRIGDLVKPGNVVEYRYDFGDCWDHRVTIEAAAEAAADVVYPACTAGQGACPPEDAGGTPGFAELKHILAGPPGSLRDEMRAWAGEDYDPARFDLAAANAAVGSAWHR
jgi:hypothetical protein